jgi:hypothetical protein
MRLDKHVTGFFVNGDVLFQYEDNVIRYGHEDAWASLEATQLCEHIVFGQHLYTIENISSTHYL